MSGILKYEREKEERKKKREEVMKPLWTKRGKGERSLRKRETAFSIEKEEEDITKGLCWTCRFRRFAYYCNLYAFSFKFRAAATATAIITFFSCFNKYVTYIEVSNIYQNHYRCRARAWGVFLRRKRALRVFHWLESSFFLSEVDFPNKQRIFSRYQHLLTSRSSSIAR